jgi:hypothetical protein
MGRIKRDTIPLSHFTKPILNEFHLVRQKNLLDKYHCSFSAQREELGWGIPSLFYKYCYFSSLYKVNPSIDIPIPGKNVSIPAKSTNKKEEFTIDLSRKTIKLQKTTEQLRSHDTIVLLRLDINAAQHRNPDSTEVGNSHLHIYKEGFSDKYAIDIPINKFSDLNDLEQTFIDFLRFCNTEKIHLRQGSLI